MVLYVQHITETSDNRLSILWLVPTGGPLLGPFYLVGQRPSAADLEARVCCPYLQIQLVPGIPFFLISETSTVPRDLIEIGFRLATAMHLGMHPLRDDTDRSELK